MNIIDFKGFTKSIGKFQCDEFGNPKLDKNGEPIFILDSIVQHHPVPGKDNHFLFFSEHFLFSGLELIEALKKETKQFGSVPSYLIIHSIELRIKGTLHLSDQSQFSYEVLKFKPFGHNIKNLLKALEGIGCNWGEGINDKQKDLLLNISRNYFSKMYEYAEKIMEENPLQLNIDDLSNIGHRLFINTEQYCNNLIQMRFQTIESE